jgi:hypothetical protein
MHFLRYFLEQKIKIKGPWSTDQVNKRVLVIRLGQFAQKANILYKFCAHFVPTGLHNAQCIMHNA